jgi:phosphoglycerate-specific signal transduction histidine kinase
MSTQQLIKQAISVSEQILQAIGEQDLQHVQQLEAQRQPLIKDAFPIQDEDSFHQLARLKILNDEIVTRLSALQQEVRAQQKSVNQGSKAARAYLANSPGQR